MHKDNLKYVGKQFLLVLFVIALGLVVFGLGLMVGYAVIGEGKHATDILSWDKWQSIIAKFTGK